MPVALVRQSLQVQDAELESGRAGLLCWPRLRVLYPLVRQLAAQGTQSLPFLHSAGAQLLSGGLPPGSGIRGGDAAVLSAPAAAAADGADDDSPTDPELFGRSVRRAAAAASSATFDAVARAAQIARANGVFVAGSVTTSSAARGRPSGSGTARRGRPVGSLPSRTARDGAEVPAIRECTIPLVRIPDEEVSPPRRSGRKRPRSSGVQAVNWDTVQLSDDEQVGGGDAERPG